MTFRVGKIFSNDTIMSPKVSIIVPVYKVEKYIDRCINSILAQTFKNFELLLVDDGSPDNSGKICDNYAQMDNRIRVFHKENAGVSAARNFGIEQSAGDFLMFVDSDDWLDLQCIELCIKEVEYGDLDLLQFASVYVSETSQWNSVNKSTSILSGDAYVNQQSLNVTVWGGLYKKAIIDMNSIRFNTQLVMAEDQLFVYKFLKFANRITYINKPLYYYFQNTNGVVRRKSIPDLKLACQHLIDMTYEWTITKKHIDTMVIALLMAILSNKCTKSDIEDVTMLFKKLKPELFNINKKSCYLFCLLSKISLPFSIALLRVAKFIGASVKR